MEPEPDNNKKPANPKIPLKEISTRLLERADLPEVCAVFKTCLGRVVSPKYLEWKFFGAPYHKTQSFFVAVHEGRIVGFIGANPVPLTVDGQLTFAYQHQDTALLEEARNLRLLRTMSEMSEENGSGPGVLFTYSITTPHMRSLVTKRMKYTVVWEDLKLVKMISLRGLVSKATRSTALNAILPGPVTRSFKTPGSMTGDITPIETFDESFRDFWNEAKMPGVNGRIFGWGEPEWLNYKFRSDALVPFECFAYRENGQVIGYLVLNVTQLEVRVCYVDALWTIPGRDDVINLLLDFTRHEATCAKCDQIATWSRLETPMGRAMTSRGFVRRPTSQCFSVKQVIHQPKPLGDLGLVGEHWNYQRGHTYYTSVGHLETEEGRQRLYKAKEEHDRDRAKRLADHS